nr:MAG TPA: hypothetical protein [Caudoviricetes sp.]
MVNAHVDKNCVICGCLVRRERMCLSAEQRDWWKAKVQTEETTCYLCWYKEELRKKGRSDKIVVKRMPYTEYKREWGTCRYVPGSYNERTKTIEVVITKMDLAHNTAWHCIPRFLRQNKKWLAGFRKSMEEYLDRGSPYSEEPDGSPAWVDRVAREVNKVYFENSGKKLRTVWRYEQL